jgi:hypothetical protein
LGKKQCCYVFPIAHKFKKSLKLIPLVANIATAILTRFIRSHRISVEGTTGGTTKQRDCSTIPVQVLQVQLHELQEDSFPRKIKTFEKRRRHIRVTSHIEKRRQIRVTSYVEKGRHIRVTPYVEIRKFCRTSVTKVNVTSGLPNTSRYVIFVGNSRVPRKSRDPEIPDPDISGIPRNPGRRR